MSTARRTGLLIVRHSRTGSTHRLVDAAAAGARAAAADGFPVRVLDAFDAGAEDVLGCAAILLGTPARFGYMSGALKDFFERIFHPLGDDTRGLPYALICKGSTDVDGAVESVGRIATGLGWRRVLAPLTVVGDVGPDESGRAEELGATLAAGIEVGIF
ncbi:MAG: flavodoxin family protein [Acidimicrobiales bacterium]